MVLSQLKINEKAKIIKFENSEKTEKRLKRMGISNGVAVTVVGFAPFRGPIKIKARDCYFAVRRKEADKITVEYL